MTEPSKKIGLHTRAALIITALSFFSYFSIYQGNQINVLLQYVFGSVPTFTFDAPINYNYIKYSNIQLVKLLTIVYSIIYLPIIFRLKNNFNSIVKFSSGIFLLMFSIIWVLLSIIGIGKISLTIITPIYWTCLFFIYFSIPQSEQAKFRYYTMKIIIIFALVNAIIIIYQFLSLKNNFSGSLAESLRLIRPEGLSYDAVLASSIVVLSMIAISMSKFHKFGEAVSYGLLIVAGFFTGARTFYVLFSVYLFFTLLFSNKTIKKKILIVLLLFFISILLFFIFYEYAKSIIEVLTNINDNNIRDQKSLFAYRLFLDNILFGVGPEQYILYETIFYGFGTNPHNVFLQILAESGLFGFIPFVIFLIISLFNKVFEKDWKSLLMIVLIMGSGVVIGIFYSVPIMTLLMLSSASNLWSENNNHV